MAIMRATAIALILVLSFANRAAAAASAPATTTVLSLDGPGWQLGTDPKNVGRDQKWCEKPTAESRSVQAPSIIQDAFPGYHGVAWYWRSFTVPANPHAGGRTLLRFWQVDYLADVWVNGVHVGQHEGGEDPFVFDITDAVKNGVANVLAVRVLNPTHDPIDGITRAETPHRNMTYPPTAGCGYNDGGLIDSVELLLAPTVRVEDLFVRPDPKTGKIRIQVNLRNAGKTAVAGHLLFTVAPAVGGETLSAVELDRDLPPGDTLLDAELVVQNPRLWELNDPFQYRVSAQVGSKTTPSSFDQQSARCGFREFRFEDGAFRLNGKRLFLKCSHSGCELPCFRVAVDPDLLRKDLLNCKVMGFNAIRFISGVAPRYQLDLCDEIGLMVYEECFAGWCLNDSPKMAERFDHDTKSMILRDRNHASITMWGLLNETPDGAVFRHAVDFLPQVRALDDTRLVMLGSGRWDNATGGVEAWCEKGKTDPCVTHNGTAQTIDNLGVKWTPGRLVFHPGKDGEYSVVRWTAPESGAADIAVTFSDASSTATTDVHVFHNGKALFNGFIHLNNAGGEAKYTGTLDVKKGDTLDCVVGNGNKFYGADSTGLDFVLKVGSATFDAAKSFAIDKNPNGPWSYGVLPPGEQPATGAFVLYAQSRGVIGSLANPESSVWQDLLGDGHPYQPVPHTANVIQTLRTVGAGRNPFFLSEHGTGSALDLPRLARHFEQWQKTASEDAVYYRERLDRFMADWERWHLSEAFANPEDYFRQCLAWMAELRESDINAIRANTNIVGYSLTGTQDQGLSGEGLTTLFRELKPGTIDAVFEAWYPLRWCLFVEPVQVYRGQKARLEAVLANEDVLPPGEYPVRFQVVGPRSVSVFDKTVTVNIPDPKSTPAPKFALPVFAEDVVIDGPSGRYRFLATFLKGGAATGGDTGFYVADAAEMPKVEPEVTLWGDDPDLAKWLTDHGIRNRPFASGAAQNARELILVGNRPAAGDAKAFRELAEHLARGSQAVFLSFDVFKKGDDAPTFWLPLAQKGVRTGLPVWLYHKDDWAKNHPIFDGLPAGCILSDTFYREIIPNNGFNGQDGLETAVAGMIDASSNYGSALTVGVFRLGAGRFVLNTLRIRENLGKDPVAERLTRNLLRFAAADTAQPVANLPPDFENQLKAMGY